MLRPPSPPAGAELDILTASYLLPEADPAPALPPAKPMRLSAELIATSGALTIRWKVKNPAGTNGTNYIVRRRLTGAGAERSFTVLGITGGKSFTDETLPAGSASVEYTVQGTRAGITGPLSHILTVNLGTIRPGERTQQGQGRLAA